MFKECTIDPPNNLDLKVNFKCCVLYDSIYRSFKDDKTIVIENS